MGTPYGVPQPAPGPVNKVRSWPGRTRQFLHDVRLELRNVTWPSREDVRSTTLVVVAATFFFGFYLGLVLDIPFARLLSWLLRAGRGLVS